MSFTESKRVPMSAVWRLMSNRVRRDLLILIGQPIEHNINNVDISARYLSLVSFSAIPEEVQEKLYNYMVQL